MAAARGAGACSTSCGRPAAPSPVYRQQARAPAQRTLRTLVARDVRSSSSAAAELPGEPPARRFSLRDFAAATWQFTRPHTIRGTLLGTTALVTKALLENPGLIDLALVPRALMGLLALLCGNGYIVGINQIYDVDIDAVNKPFLPIAAGALTPAAGWALCAGFAAVGTALAAIHFDRLIAGLYVFGLFLGTIYSVPPLRLKRFAVPAFLIIATVRGVLLNFGVYYATRAALGLAFAWSPAVAFITAFVTLFATAIAITKDLPDIEGDVQYGIKTFATEIGVRRIALLGSGIILSAYLGAIYLAFSYPGLYRSGVMAAGHGLFGLVLVLRTWVLDNADYSAASIKAYYRWVWNLFYCEYLLFPFV